MVSLDILEVVIGLAFIYMILSLITSTLTEFISQIFAMRGSNLRHGIQTLLNDIEGKGLAEKFYDHPLIKSLAHRDFFLRGVRQPLPSYINPQTFAQAILDLIANDGKFLGPEFKYFSDLSFKDAENFLETLNSSSLFNENPEAKRQLQIVLQGAKSLEDAQKAIGEWFNNMGDRMAGWYKRNVQVITLLISLIVTIAVNADSLSLFNRLSNDPAARSALVSAAQDAIQKDLVATPTPEATLQPESTATPASAPDLGGTVDKVDKLQQQINNSFQLVGWAAPPTAPATDADQKTKDKYKSDLDAYPQNPQRFPQNSSELISKIIGLLITTFAVSLGAPFWFDILKRVMNLRSSGGVSGDTTTAPPPPPAVVVVTPSKPDDQTGVG